MGYKKIDIYRHMTMPKTDIDYKKTKIYYIPVGNKRYYGHTTQTLPKRKNHHRGAFRIQGERKVYKAMREIGMTAYDIKLIWVEDYPCENVYQAQAREQWWVELDGSLNTQMPNSNYAQQQHDWKTKRIECDECGKKLARSSLTRHKKGACKGSCKVE
jgi:hypothetical protein